MKIQNILLGLLAMAVVIFAGVYPVYAKLVLGVGFGALCFHGGYTFWKNAYASRLREVKHNAQRSVLKRELGV